MLFRDRGTYSWIVRPSNPAITWSSGINQGFEFINCSIIHLVLNEVTE